MCDFWLLGFFYFVPELAPLAIFTDSGSREIIAKLGFVVPRSMGFFSNLNIAMGEGTLI